MAFRWLASQGTQPKIRVPEFGRVPRILLSEGSSLTSRETITALGPAGHLIDVMDPDPFCLARLSRWVRRVIRCPAMGVDPVGYLDAVVAQLGRESYDVLLPTHEQAYLFAAMRDRIPDHVGLAVAGASAFARVQSKVEFADLLRELDLPQPESFRLGDPAELDHHPYPYWLKAAYSTAGQGVRQVRDERERDESLALLWPAPDGLLVQSPAGGRYCQVQALFTHGRMIAVHTNTGTATGMGGSAAARASVEHAAPREHMARIGEALAWHGGITLDYFWEERRGPSYLECNPRTVEPGNAVASGVPLPDLQVRLSLGERFEGPPVTGRAGVRTHSLLAICIGAADSTGSRWALLRELGSALAGRGTYRNSEEILLPLRRDPPSAIALAYVVARLLARPASAAKIARGAVDAYSLKPETLQSLKR